MAGEWIKMECSTPDKPEVLALTVLLGWDDPDLTVGKLFRLWRWFDTHTTDGNARGVSAALLDKQVGVTGFIEKVEKVGWLSVTSEGVSLSNFDYHTGATAKNRAQTAKRVANHKSNAKANAEANADAVSEALAREEKRREEIPVPNGTGDKSPPDLTKDELWTVGKSLLTQAGMPAKQCGSFVGKLVKDYTDSVVIEAVRAAVVARPADPAEYLKAACMHAAGERKTSKPLSFAQQDAIDKRRNWEQMTGRKWPESGTPPDFIDMETPPLEIEQ